MNDRDENVQPAVTGGADWLSMSTDNTAAGRASDPVNAGPISLVREGMRVVDAGGQEIGKVDEVRMGDPGSVTAREPGFTEGETTIDEIGRAIFGVGSQLPGPVRETLLRIGYIRIDGKGWLFDKDHYAASDQIAKVEGDIVHLSVAEAVLPDA